MKTSTTIIVTTMSLNIMSLIAQTAVKPYASTTLLTRTILYVPLAVKKLGKLKFATAIATADSKRLSTIKGLGKKTAEKIILALHGKISAGEIMQASGELGAGSTKAVKAEKLSAMDEDAVAALQGLGFTRAESLQAVKKAKEQGATSVEDIIMRALQGAL